MCGFHSNDDLNRKHPEIIEKCETLAADKGYDDVKFHKKLWKTGKNMEH